MPDAPLRGTDCIFPALQRSQGFEIVFLLGRASLVGNPPAVVSTAAGAIEDDNAIRRMMRGFAEDYSMFRSS